MASAAFAALETGKNLYEIYKEYKEDETNLEKKPELIMNLISNVIKNAMNLRAKSRFDQKLTKDEKNMIAFISTSQMITNLFSQDKLSLATIEEALVFHFDIEIQLYAEFSIQLDSDFVKKNIHWLKLIQETAKRLLDIFNEKRAADQFKLGEFIGKALASAEVLKATLSKGVPEERKRYAKELKAAVEKREAERKKRME